MKVGVLVCPPMSMTLVFSHGSMFVFDSHVHYEYGAAVIVPSSREVAADDLANHLVRYVTEFHNCDLSETLLAMLELD